MQNIMNDTVANIWAEMSEEERQDKILSVMNNVDAAIKFAAYDWNELPDGITNLIDSNAPLNELNKHKKLKNTMNKSLLKSLIKECYQEVLAEKSMASKKMSKIKSLKENDTKTVEDAIKSGKIKPEEVKAAAEKAMKGDSTALAMMMAGIPNMMQENEEMDLPSDTGKNINMGFDNNIGLDVDKRMSKNMSEVMGKIEMLKNKLAPFIADFKAKKLSRQQYEEATIGLRASIAAAKADLEKMIAKL